MAESVLGNNSHWSRHRGLSETGVLEKGENTQL